MLKRPISTATGRTRKLLRAKPAPDATPHAGRPTSSDAASSPVSSSPPPTSLLDNVDLSKLGPVLKRLQQNPELAYLLASIKKGLASAIRQGVQLDKGSVVAALKQQLENNPTLLAAIRDYRGA